MSVQIHPTAIVDASCVLGEGVEIGPSCVLRGPITLGPGVRLLNHVTVQGPCEIGAETIVYPGACLGFPPQDYKFTLGMPTGGIKIGSKCLIREHVTVHAASKVDRPTLIGDRVFMMVGSHAGHDATVENDVILVNSALLAGHSLVQEKAIMSGNSALHQFCRVGRLAMVSGVTPVLKDVPPFCVNGSRNVLNGVNLVGMRRSGMPREHITAVRNAFVEVLRVRLPIKEMAQRLEELGKDCEPVMEMARFVATTKRGICPGTGSSIEHEGEAI